MFFSITGLPDALNFGKHYFNLALLDSYNQEYRLRDNSRILFEFKSVNNVVLKSDIVKLNQRNGVASCFVEVLKDPLRTFKEVEDGEGTLTVVGSLQNKSSTRTPIPKKFEGAMNYRCTFPIEIRKNLLNADSPRTIQSDHKLTTAMGQFSFSKASITARRNQDSGYEYSATGFPSSNPIFTLDTT
jgi:hypothetical protein